MTTVLLLILLIAMVTIGGHALLTWARKDRFYATDHFRAYDELGSLDDRHHLLPRG